MDKEELKQRTFNSINSAKTAHTKTFQTDKKMQNKTDLSGSVIQQRSFSSSSHNGNIFNKKNQLSKKI